jgi:hypothetical protein
MTTAADHTTKARRKRKALSKFDHGTISEAFGFLAKVPSSQLRIDVKQYATGYLALRHLIRDNIDFSNPRELLAASFAVYGWMPTILKRFEKLDLLSKFILQIQPLSLAEGIKVVREEATDNGGQALQALNNSVVGTSKLLHFVRPDLFPIWDSRIAKLFGFANGRHNTPGAYLGYFELLHAWCSSGHTFPDTLHNILTHDSPEGDPISQIRLTEYCLFLASVERHGIEPSEDD